MSSKRIPMALPLQRQTIEGSWPIRAATRDDADDLAILLYAAFRGTVDDEGESFDEAVREIEKTLTGAYGRLLFDCSFVIEDSGLLASACLISFYEPSASPFVVYTMTRPEFKGRGMGRTLLKRSINGLVDRGYARLELIVTDGNVPAQRLYTALGFRAIEES